MYREKYHLIRDFCDRLGQYDYKEVSFVSDIREINGNEFGSDFVYYGQTKPGSEIRHGIGICVYSNGTTIMFYKIFALNCPNKDNLFLINAYW